MMQSLLAQRDQLITLLARADPAVAERLADACAMPRATGPTAGNDQCQVATLKTDCVMYTIDSHIKETPQIASTYLTTLSAELSAGSSSSQRGLSQRSI